MRKFAWLLLTSGLILLALTNAGLISSGEECLFSLSRHLPPISPSTAFVDVAVIPMDRERIIEGQTVIVRAWVIKAIGNTDQVEVPLEAFIVDGRGRYLMPGLADMHVHVEYPNDLLLFVANGVTTVRNMWGNTGKKLAIGLPDQLELRRLIAQGELLGPMIYTAGPVMEGSPAFHPLAEVFDSPEAARESVAWQKAQGYDFIKVYDHLSPEVYEAILDEAKQQQMPVVGHVPFAVGLDGVLASGQLTIEHLTGYIDPDAVEFIIPDDQRDEYAARTRQAGVWNCVTLVEYPKSKQPPEGFQRLQNQPGMAYLSPFTRTALPFHILHGVEESHLRGRRLRGASGGTRPPNGESFTRGRRGDPARHGCGAGIPPARFFHPRGAGLARGGRADPVRSIGRRDARRGDRDGARG